MDYKRVDKKAKAYWRLGLLLWLIILVPVCLVLYFVAGTVGQIIALSLAVIYLLVFILHPIIEYAQWSYGITEDRIEIKKGIYFKSHNIIPTGRIQHVNIAKGPVMRLFGLNKVEIHTAGGAFSIMGLDKETAEQVGNTLHGFISKKLKAIKASEQSLQQPE